MTTRRLFAGTNLLVQSIVTGLAARSVRSVVRRSASVAVLAGIVLTCACLACAQQAQGYPPPAPPVCKRTVRADVVALDQAFYNNRVGAFQAGGMIFALRRDVVSTSPSTVAGLEPGKVTLRSDKRPRPIVLRANVGDCLEISFQNLLSPQPWVGKPPVDSGITQPSTQPGTRYAGVHAMGMQVVSARKPDSSGNLQLVAPISGDGSWVGKNDVFNTSNATSGLVAPGDRIVYTIRAAAEGAYLLYSTAADIGQSPDFGGQLSEGLFGSVTVQPETAEAYRSQVTHDDLLLATFRSAALPPNMTLAPKLDGNGQQETIVFEGKTWPLWVLTTRDDETSSTATVILDDGSGNPVQPVQNGYVRTPDGHPVINYLAMYPSSGTDCGKPILKMIDFPRQRDSYGVCAPRPGAAPETYYTDLTAIITGPKAGRFPLWVDSPSFNQNPASPDRRQPYREFAIHYHDDFTATQAFSQFENPSDPIQYTLRAGRDFFAINYGMGGIGPEVWANRIGVGPMYQCATCKFEEFFLSSWPNGDPAMIVDVPANSIDPVTKQVKKGPKATKALYPDDPSNVYHSYIKDHVKFRVLHAGTNITHVHHQHAHQWLHTPNSDDSHYRDSQMISPGAAYTLEQVYNGSGNLNQVVGDSIFHCHFYPHFAQGMWYHWRHNDTFQTGTILTGTP
ncbi:MAG TPA: hypothetical protein VFV34_14680, partial [Blastocatellia bacterium]|nr:hypothetical protein [Blastocatellia bacterium]